MCIAILKPKGKTISKDILKTCHESNPDGGGFMYCHDNVLHLKKGFMRFDDFYNSFKKVNSFNHDMLIHFRIKTHGAISKANCHPFLVSQDIGFIHNGIIDIKTSGVESDTMAFNRHILKNIFDLRSVIESQGIQELISDYIGNSKLVFLDNRSNHTIINEHLGIWDNGSWFSNSSFDSCDTKINAPYEYEIYDAWSPINCYSCDNELITDEELINEICGDCAKTDKYYKKWFLNDSPYKGR